MNQECKADCFQDICHGSCIRPIDSPTRLVWGYFNVTGLVTGTLESRQFNSCSCGCGKLVANPPANVDTHASLL